MVNNLGFGFILAFGIVFLNRLYNLTEQILNSETPKRGTIIVFVISFFLFIIVDIIVMYIVPDLIPSLQ